MKIFSIILGNIPSQFSDLNFGHFLEASKLEWWRYTPLNYFIATPDYYNTKMIFEIVKRCYPGVISAVFEVKVLDWYGAGPIVEDQGKDVSFLYWFEKITDKNFIPAWKRAETDKPKYVNPTERLTIVESKPYKSKDLGNS